MKLDIKEQTHKRFQTYLNYSGFSDIKMSIILGVTRHTIYALRNNLSKFSSKYRGCLPIEYETMIFNDYLCSLVGTLVDISKIENYNRLIGEPYTIKYKQQTQDKNLYYIKIVKKLKGDK